MSDAAELQAPFGMTAFGVAKSFSGRRWRLNGGNEDLARALQRELLLSPVLARLLAARGIGLADARGFLHPTLKEFLPDPLQLAEMDMAIARAKRALEKGERIAVLGDYDVDGSVSAALLAGFFTHLGSVPRIYIPDRLGEGYGPSPSAIAALHGEGVSLVLTVDCGAAGGAAFDRAQELGLDMVVLDHHRVERRPPALAHVNPNQPADRSGLTHLCAAGVTFLFLVGLNRALREDGFYAGRAEPDLREALDLVGLATVCDVVPLVGVNRAFVRQGLAQLSKLSRPGLAALAGIAKACPPFSVYHLGFIFGPRINAGGRVGRSSLGADLLSTQDETLALDFAQKLDRHNRERREIERAILDEALALAAIQDNAPFVLVAGEGWHPGVVGIVASRLRERFAKPAFVTGFEGGMGRGSARSIPGLDIGRIVRTAREQGVIEAGGGHAMAAGFSLTEDRLSAFRQFLETQFVGAAYEEAACLEVDAISSPAAANRALVSEIALAGPYGAGNPEPVLAFPDVRVAYADTVGDSHVKARLVRDDGSRLDAIAFRVLGTPLGEGLLKSRGRFVHAAGRLKCEEWNGEFRVQLLLEDAAPAGA